MKCVSNVHTHCTWCDGVGTPRRVVEAALALGFSDIGFSSHAPAPFDPTCPGVADEKAYRQDIHALKEEFAGRISVLCGMEQDYFAPVNGVNYDYVIGSSHYLPIDGNSCIAADGHIDKVIQARDEEFGADGIAMATAFYQMSADHIRRDKPDIVGHYDVITKFNKDGTLFDEDSSAYKNAALESLDEIISTVKEYDGMIEVNTGALVRGLREVPYPAPFMLQHMAQRGVRAIITADSHKVETLNGGFDQALAFMQQAGFTSMAVLQNGKFVDVKIQ